MGSTVVLSRACRKILELVREADHPVGVLELTQITGTHGNTVREHLATLRSAQLVRREPAPSHGRGRPAWLYQPDVTQTHDYARLATALADQLTRISSDPQGEAVEAGERWGDSLQPEDSGDHSVREQVITMLDELGFSPDLDVDDDSVRLRSCPMIEAASARPDVVCSVHEGIIRGFVKSIGADPAEAELLAFYEPDACHVHFHNTARG